MEICPGKKECRLVKVRENTGGTYREWWDKGKKHTQPNWNSWRKKSGGMCVKGVSARTKGAVYKKVLGPERLFRDHRGKKNAKVLFGSDMDG